jgi:hypothetical protein
MGLLGGPGWFSRYSDWLRAERSADGILVGLDFPHLSRPVLGPTQPPIKWVPCLSGGWDKAAGAWRCLPTPFSTEVKERVGLYLYSPFEPSWPVLGWTLPSPMGLLENSVRDGDICEKPPRYLTYLVTVISLKLVIQLKKLTLKDSVPLLHGIGCSCMK